MNMYPDFNNLLFLPIEIDRPPYIPYERFHAITLPESGIYDPYRTCYHIPIIGDDMEFSEIAKTQFPELVEYSESVILPLTGMTRIVIISTPTTWKNDIHIDCSPERFKTTQHKFRFVMHGNVDDLVFVGDGKEVRVPQVHQPFIMDGKWPHYMVNTHHRTKFTFAVGSPWEPEVKGDYLKLLQNAYDKNNKHYVSSDNLKLPKNHEQYFNQKKYA